ncbi:putative N-acetyltransferase HLS1 [Gossypium australe]|uniref:Putative N-acetyltransferase HLS1 n=1 Tax=Gossypium australe TaxID=47621 RepID=A0A5B6WXQ7_9ROSI|nr:putative N-acetyltransferase HLS1 [Gossypium australe]
MGYGSGELIIRSYNAQNDRVRVEGLESICEVGPADKAFLFTDTLGDPICRIKNSPISNMLVAELGGQLVGVIQGTIKLVTLHKPPKNVAKVGYILGLRVAPAYRRQGIGSRLVTKLEEWFVACDVDYTYMATEKDNDASYKLFVNKLGYVKFRTPAILVNPVNHHRSSQISSNFKLTKLKIEEAESLYRKYLSSTEFFPIDIGNILRNKLSLGTWVAYPKGETWGKVPTSWAMLSVWNSGELFKLRLGNVPISCFMYTQISQLIQKFLPCFKLPSIPDFFNPFGFYFIYGVYGEGPLYGKLVKSLCNFVHNMASSKSKDCKVIVTEIGGNDTRSKLHIPHRKSMSCSEDLWCIKSLKNEDRKSVHKLTTMPPTRALFVDPREV